MAARGGSVSQGEGRARVLVDGHPPEAHPGARPDDGGRGDIPHDLYTFVIERELGLQHGFWGCVSEGATFRTLGRKRTEPGKAVIRRHVGDLDAAESRVNDVYFSWRAGGDTPVNAALDEMLARWRNLGEGEGEELVLNWPDR